ncbi:hypothetical protein MKZ38_001998 [Zalerion maritima]|uniref:Pre-mRNA splicing factor CLF1 n=1 Tax=Zalerion maritima TaxID=339359 RepID=A0AAD5RQX9_9PEZI|nr:hypothetical protein MKZ38_001998 [Zalerion maritima]
MTIPTPTVPLEDICSVVYNNTLYTYSSQAFQSLEFAEGAQWAELPSGVAVDGGVCVGTTPDSSAEAAFYVVGGTSNDSDYQGLQKFTYSAGEWESVSLSAPVTQSRLWHGAAYINDSDTILMYAGSQDGSQNPSTQTFTIHIADNHSVLAWESIAPPTISPILLPWSESHVVLVGGSTDNTAVMIFSTDGGWADSGASLEDPIADGMKASLVGGDDGCKNLYTYGMSTSPNEVNRTVLIDGSGQPIVNSAPITKRELTLDHWPRYNSSLAPKATRSSYAVATDESGLVVIAGGNEDDVFCMFQSTENEWMDAGAIFSEKKVAIESIPSSSVSETSTAIDTSGPTTTGTEGASSSSISSDGISPNTLLGAVLGSILGAAVILIIALFLLRRRKQRLAYVEAGHARRDSGAAAMEKHDVGFATDFSNPGSGASGGFHGHQQQDSQSSFSSMAILMGKMGQNKQQAALPVMRKPSFNKASKDSEGPPKPIMNPPMPRENPAPIMVARDERGVSFSSDVEDPPNRPQGQQTGTEPQGTRRSSGWNKYWSGGSALNILGFNNSKRNTVGSVSSSKYSDPHRITQDSATVPALRLDPNERLPPLGLQRVNSGSPTIAQYSSKTPLKEGMVGQIERPMSRDSMSNYSSGIPTSVQESWDPIDSKRPWGTDRAPSSAYSQTSMYPTPLGYPNHSDHPMPKLGTSSISQQPQLAMASVSTDMSWLNLGEQARGR